MLANDTHLELLQVGVHFLQRTLQCHVLQSKSAFIDSK